MFLSGYIAAAVTPFKDGKIDYASFSKYLRYLINNGMKSIVICGSTGESLSLSLSEKIDIILFASDITKEHNINLIVGVIDSCTSNCIEIIKATNNVAKSFLCICPYYVKPSQEQIYNHFAMLSNVSSNGIILYNNPSRTGVNIDYYTFEKLGLLNNIIGIKECANELTRFTLWKHQIKKNDFAFLTGNDDTSAAALTVGADGVISVSANVCPKMCIDMYTALKEKNMEKFTALNIQLAVLHELMFKEPSPAPAKYALKKIGVIADDALKAPLSTISEALKTKIDDYLQHYGLINE